MNVTVTNSIINSCKKSDENAFRLLYEASIPYVYTIVSRYIKVEVDKKDIIQEIFAKTFTTIHSFDEKKGEFKYWIRKIAVNECLMNLRSKPKLDVVALNINHDSIDTGSPEKIELTREDITDLLLNMPEKYKIVFMAYIIDGFNHKEIAQQLNISPETSRSQLNRAKKWIKSNIFKNNKHIAYGIF